jgi:transcriptional regulator with XRE-family HTH domain
MPASDGERVRPSWVDLLERYRSAAGRPWYEIDAAAGVNPKTREQWLSGLVRSPPLIGILRIADELSVPPDELFAAVLDDESDTAPPVRVLIQTQLSELQYRADDILEYHHKLRVRVQRLEATLAGAGLQEILDEVRAADAEEARRYEERRREREDGTEPSG